MNPRYITKEDKSVRESNKTPLFFDLHKENFRKNINNGETIFLTLYNTKKKEHSKLPMTKHDNNYRLRNNIVNNMESMKLTSTEKEQVKTKKDGSIVLDNDGKTIPLYSYDYIMKHKLRANKIDNLIYVSNEDIREQLNFFTSDQLTFLNEYLENGTIKPIELIEDAKRYNVDENTDEDNLIAWVENKINKINVNRDDANLYHDIQKLVLTMFACEPTLEEEIKKLHNDIKALYTTGNDDKSKAAEAAAKKLKELRKEHADAFEKLMAELELNANKQSHSLQEKLKNKRKALENNAADLETIEQDLIEFQIENTSDEKIRIELLDKIRKKYDTTNEILENEKDQKIKERQEALQKRREALQKRRKALLMKNDLQKVKTPLHTPDGSRVSTANEPGKAAQYREEHIEALETFENEKKVKQKAAHQNLQKKLQQLRKKNEETLQKIKEIKEKKSQLQQEIANESDNGKKDELNKQYEQLNEEHKKQLEELEVLKNEYAEENRLLKKELKRITDTAQMESVKRLTDGKRSQDYSEQKEIKRYENIVGDYESDLKEINEEIQNVDQGNIKTTLMDNWQKFHKLNEQKDALNAKRANLKVANRRKNDQKVANNIININNKIEALQKEIDSIDFTKNERKQMEREQIFPSIAGLFTEEEKEEEKKQKQKQIKGSYNVAATNDMNATNVARQSASKRLDKRIDSKTRRPNTAYSTSRKKTSNINRPSTGNSTKKPTIEPNSWTENTPEITPKNTPRAASYFDPVKFD